MTIDTLRDKTELLWHDYQAYLTELAHFADRQKQVEEQEALLIEHEKTLTNREFKLAAKEKAFLMEKEYVEERVRDLKTRELRLEQVQKELKSIEMESDRLDAKVQALVDQEQVIEQKTKELQKAKDLQTVMERQVSLDRERKRLLDLREQRIAMTEKRLQIEATI